MKTPPFISFGAVLAALTILCLHALAPHCYGSIIYVDDQGKYGQVKSWWTKSPGATPAAGYPADVEAAIYARANAIMAEAGCAGRFAPWNGQALVYGQSALLIVGGTMGWAAPEFPAGTTSGLHFQSQWYSNVGNSNHISYSCAPAIFGLTDVENNADSWVLEGAAGPAGCVDDQTIGGYWANFTKGRYWSVITDQIMVNAYGPLVVAPELASSWQSGLALVVLMAVPRIRRKR